MAHFWTESFGQIYPALRALVHDGLAGVTERAGGGRPPRRQYRITARGRAALAQWLSVPPRPVAPRDELQLKLWLATERPASVLPHLAAFRARMAARAATCRSAAAGFPADADPERIVQRLTLRWGTATAEAAVRWADEAMRELEPLVQVEET